MAMPWCAHTHWRSVVFYLCFSLDELNQFESHVTKELERFIDIVAFHWAGPRIRIPGEAQTARSGAVGKRWQRKIKAEEWSRGCGHSRGKDIFFTVILQSVKITVLFICNSCIKILHKKPTSSVEAVVFDGAWLLLLVMKNWNTTAQWAWGNSVLLLPFKDTTVGSLKVLLPFPWVQNYMLGKGSTDWNNADGESGVCAWDCNSSHRRPEQRFFWAEWCCKSAEQKRRRHCSSLWLGHLLNRRGGLGQSVLEFSFMNLPIHFRKSLGNHVDLFQFCSSSACVLSGSLLD